MATLGRVKTEIVTGGSGEIGRAVASRLARDGVGHPAGAQAGMARLRASIGG